MRLIDADALFLPDENSDRFLIVGPRSGKTYALAMALLRQKVDNAPTIEAPVRHGRWVSLTGCANEGVYCSICKKKVWKSDYDLYSQNSRNKLRFNYCHNCGAKMDLEET